MGKGKIIGWLGVCQDGFWANIRENILLSR